MPRPLLPLLAILSLVSAATCSTAAPEYIWLEGESPTRANVQFDAAGWGHPEYLSGGKWLFAAADGKDVEAKIPADGALLTYDFTARSTSDYEVWARIGYEFARAPFRWRIDGGDWKEVKPDDLTTDLMALGDWAEVAWLKLGSAPLAEGKHAFEVKLERHYEEKNGKKEPQRFLFGLDCLCISKGPFRPDGKWKPDEDGRLEIDRQAAGQVFEVKPAEGDGERAVLSLGGVWQIARYDEQEIKDRTEPIRELPADLDPLHWKGIKVPGNRDSERPDLLYCHRFLYRTRVKVPADLKGRSFFIHFPCTSLIASVFVNGRYCGGSTAPATARDCDVTAALKPGEVNEIVIGIKDYYYALGQDGNGRSVRYLFNVPTEWVYSAGGLNLTRFADFPVLLRVRSNGIVELPSLIVAGPAYTSDVFAMPSVKKKELGLEITVNNPTAGPLVVKIRNEVVPLGGKDAEKTFAVKELEIPAGKEQTVKLAEPWDNPKLWWPDDPQQYQVVTKLEIGGRVVDVKRTKFGFREWEWTGQAFKLNGIPWHLRADLQDFDTKDPEQAVKDWRASGQNMFRYWGERPWTGSTQEETLDFFDAHGVPVRRSGIFDGEGASYLLLDGPKARTALFDNWRHQLRAWVKAERNHPSVFVWSIENEITYINSRNFGWLDQEEPEIRKAVQEVMALDPTRPAMIDGGDALRDRSLPIYGSHYIESPLREYPDEAYTLANAFRSAGKPGPNPWPIGDDRPLFLGETFFASGSTPSAYAQVGGESCFLGWSDARKGVGLLAKMMSEGYRWHGVAAFHFWFGPDRADLHHNSWQPVCVLCGEWNWAFGSGQEVQRTLKVFNDTRFDDPIDMHWQFRIGDRTVAEGGKTLALTPGLAEETAIRFQAPAVKERTAGELVLTCARKGHEVFREIKPLAILDTDGAPRPAVMGAELVVLDPRGAVKDRLEKRGIPFSAVDSPDAVPAGAKVLVIGPDALTPRQATDPRWLALAAGGTRLLVLDQENPLHYQAVPADLDVTPYDGRIAFPENLDHPVFAGLGQADFFTWSGDAIVYRHAYKKASKGARSLVQCDEELSCSALAECGVRDSVMLLCQLAVGAKLDSDPVAQRLFDNMLAYCAAYRPVARTTAVVLPAADLRPKLLDAAGLRAQKADDVMAAVSDPSNEIVVADASPDNLKKLAAGRDAVKAFTERGGWLMLWGLTPDGLADFNRLVGQHHVIRPFKMERVTLAAVRDPLTAGLTMRDVVLESSERIYPWAGDRYPANDTFTHVVDLDDIAPFCTSAKYGYGWSQMTNGLTSADSWKFIFYHELKSDPKPVWSAELPKEEEVQSFSIVVNAHYRVIKKMRLIFDGDTAHALTLDLKPQAELRQDVSIDPPRKCKTIALEPLEYDAADKQPTTGVDNIWIKVKRSDDYRREVVPLLNIGALVKYRMGKGGVLLNQVRIQEKEANPVNGEKKQTIVATLLRNLGAAFAGEKLVIAGAGLRYQPIPLDDKCNQYLTGDKGWINGQPDLGNFPVGESRLAGVTYLIRDFKTSPSCIMLTGPDAKGTLPQAVEGIPVGRRADALFFLHTFHQTKESKPAGRPDEGPPPVVFTYVIHYDDGKTAEVAVRLGRGVGHWISDRPQGLPEAAVAWAAPLPKGPAGQQAVVYQMQWTNPRPGEAIHSIDVRYDAKVGSAYGLPIVLGITAGTAAE